ncbi:gamma-glutamyl-gamma-aminobutyrate hydrolase family protein [Nocardia australiensis]|uniref:gamma-glutamyl-gamma-aminobutyrate hydrolase family protein n=1 Tax=Nocardia australiensis TaxID=2887191 RepID=UPI001D155286|nr:gamma-glutamyl-gamma-aminobutyrate hydrolase family protein [Nocardia australiensis]
MVSNDYDAVAANDVGARPVIGVSTYSEPTRYGPWHVDSAVLPRSYVDMVERAGGIPVLLPPVGAARREVVARLDGLVLAGGADIDPVRYGAARDVSTRETRTERDEFEFELFALARAAGVPILAICRGLQLVNIAFGGTLIQHLPDLPGRDEHVRAPGVFGITRVSTEPGSRVAAITGHELKVHCHHHQAIDVLGAGLVAVAHAADGTIEAAETSSGPFLVAVQWHPEADSTDDRLMRALVEAAAARTEPWSAPSEGS